MSAHNSAHKTLLVMAGGTGGHIFPALAVADILRQQGWRVVWLGNPNGMEAKLVPARGYECAWVQFAAVRGKGLMRKLMLPVNLLRACAAARRVIRQVHPDVVLGMGGYITFPGGVMARLAGVPLVVHEQNAVAGLANKVLSHIATRVLTGFPDTLPNATWVGNPVRVDIATLPEPQERYSARADNEPLHVLVVGGSLGAKALNDTVPQALALIPADQRPQVTHQSGAKQIDALRASYAAAGVEAMLTPFIEDTATAFAQADLVICRAGASTVTELAAVGAAAVYVPFPHAVDDHQTTNARFVVDAGGGWLLPQSELTPQRLAQLLQTVTRDELLQRAQAAKALEKTEATSRIVAACEELAS